MIRFVLAMSHPDRNTEFGLAALNKHTVREVVQLVQAANVARLLCQQRDITLHHAPRLILDLGAPYLKLKQYEQLDPAQDEALHGLLGEAPGDDVWELVNKTCYNLLDGCPNLDVPGNAQIIVRPDAFYWEWDGYFSGLIPISVLNPEQK